MLGSFEVLPVLLELQIVLVSDQRAYDFYFATASGELKGVRLQVEKHLLDSLPVSANFEVVTEALERATKVDFEGLSLHHLDLSNILDCFLNVERGEVFPEFALLQLGVIQNVIDEEA